MVVAIVAIAGLRRRISAAALSALAGDAKIPNTPAPLPVIEATRAPSSSSWALVWAISGHRTIATRARSLTYRCSEVCPAITSPTSLSEALPLQWSGFRSR